VVARQVPRAVSFRVYRSLQYRGAHHLNLAGGMRSAPASRRP